MDAKDKRIKELEEELEFYKSSPTAEWYRALTSGLKKIAIKIDEEELDLREDSFANSIIQIAEKSDRIFTALEKGASLFKPQDLDSDKKKKLDKTGTSVAV